MLSNHLACIYCQSRVNVQGVYLIWTNCNLLNKQTAVWRQHSTPCWQKLWSTIWWMLSCFPQKQIAQSPCASTEPVYLCEVLHILLLDFHFIDSKWRQVIHVSTIVCGYCCSEILTAPIHSVADFLPTQAWPSLDSCTWLRQLWLVGCCWPVTCYRLSLHSSAPLVFPTQSSCMGHWCAPCLSVASCSSRAQELNFNSSL